MANKFLGLDSINVLKKYIDDQLTVSNINTRVITIQAYAYYKDGETVITPIGGGFDTEAVAVEYPNGWYSLKYVLDSLNNKETGETVDTALANGSIWMSIGVVEGSSSIEWSAPMKVSGQNGISVKFQYSYDSNATEDKRYYNPKGVNSENRVEYVWTKTGDSNWVGPAIWAMYSKDAREVLWRWKVTAETDVDEDGIPVQPNKPQTGETGWMSNIATLSLSNKYPYMWMSYQIVPSGSQPSDNNWTEPVLFGHWGKDGKDGAVPDYTQTLYHKGLSNGEISEIEGIIAPEKPEFITNGKIEDYIKDGWVELPQDNEDDNFVIWWQCTFKVDGRTQKVLNKNSIGAVKRYNAIDGTAKSGQFTMNLYAWSTDQAQPEMSETLIGGWRPENYYYLPDKPVNITTPEPSLWMITANVSGLDEDGKPIVNGSWSEPVKLTGPRGPISYDYRIETRYNIGTSNKPKETPQDAEWYKDIPEITSQYPYIWAVNYLVCYKMKYGNIDPLTGEYKIVQDGENGTIIEEYDYFRLSGIDGEDGNRKNSVIYSDTGETLSVKSFSSENMYISNTAADVDVTYNIELDTLTFINGYTGKFANIGKGNMIINAGDFKFVGSTIETKTITILPQETIELVCFNKDKNKVLLVIGKDISE